MRLKAENIQLRALEPSDLDLLYAWENREDIAKASNLRMPYSRESLRKYLDHVQEDVWKVGQLRLMIEVDEQCIGTVELFDLEAVHSKAGIGIMIADEMDRGKGFAREALHIFCDYCRDSLGLRQLYCQILESNTRSHSLFEAVGFVRSGVLKNWIRSGQEFEDAWFYQRLMA